MECPLNESKRIGYYIAEDYQQNLEITNMENPTSMANTTNKITKSLSQWFLEYEWFVSKWWILFGSDKGGDNGDVSREWMVLQR